MQKLWCLGSVKGVCKLRKMAILEREARIQVWIKKVWNWNETERGWGWSKGRNKYMYWFCVSKVYGKMPKLPNFV